MLGFCLVAHVWYRVALGVEAVQCAATDGNQPEMRTILEETAHDRWPHGISTFRDRPGSPRAASLRFCCSHHRLLRRAPASFLTRGDFLSFAVLGRRTRTGRPDKTPDTLRGLRSQRLQVTASRSDARFSRR